ncbi:hypothetical protein BDR26DRAFT_851843 [Obelidium mucronatum]|nr:hypothetical protein BDR26DRAFT_851843 [Obelidium mucronatum]
MSLHHFRDPALPVPPTSEAETLAPPQRLAPVAALPAPIRQPEMEYNQSSKNLKKKHTLILSVEKTRSKILGLEREIPSLISKASIRNELASLYSNSKQCEEKLANEEHTMSLQIMKIKNTITTLLEYLKRSDLGSTNVRIVRQTMESVEHDITAFREINREKMDLLLLEEKEISQEMIPISERIDSFVNAHLSDECLNIATAAEEDQRRHLQNEPDLILSEVKAFQDYLVRHGGYYGGWDDLSHAAFMKLRQKYGANDSRFLASCVSSIPGIGFKDAQDHEIWYRKFKSLLDSKKEAITVWKQQKAAAAAKAEEDLAKTAESTKDISAMKMELEFEAREKSKRDLELWKEKQNRIMNEKRKRELDQKERLAQEKERWREKNELLKEKVQSYTREKMLQEAIQKQLLEEARLLEHAANEKAAKAELERLKQKDAEFLAQKKQKQLSKQISQKDREERLNKIRSTVEVTAVKDPLRVLRPTKGLENRMLAEPDTRAGKKFEAVVMPKRSVPSWRRGL